MPEDWTGFRVRCTAPSQFAAHNYLEVGDEGVVERMMSNCIVIVGDPLGMGSSKNRFIVLSGDNTNNIEDTFFD
jgi:hypothetical protein